MPAISQGRVTESARLLTIDAERSSTVGATRRTECLRDAAASSDLTLQDVDLGIDRLAVQGPLLAPRIAGVQRPRPADLYPRHITITTPAWLNIDEIHQPDSRFMEVFTSADSFHRLPPQVIGSPSQDRRGISQFRMKLRRAQPPEHDADTILNVLDTEMRIMLAQ